jgi:hypothetical protein
LICKWGVYSCFDWEDWGLSLDEFQNKSLVVQAIGWRLKIFFVQNKLTKRRRRDEEDID